MCGGGGIGLDLADLKFYDPNPTWPANKFFFVIQPNPSRPKNQPNPAGSVGLGRFWQVSALVAHPYSSIIHACVF